MLDSAQALLQLWVGISRFHSRRQKIWRLFNKRGDVSPSAVAYLGAPDSSSNSSRES
jgi:hypothetical protein